MVLCTGCLQLGGSAGTKPSAAPTIPTLQLTPPPSARCQLPVAGFLGGRRVWAGLLDLASGHNVPAALPAGSPTASEVTYDARTSRWLPVPERAVSPDGRSYARLDITPASTGASAAAQLNVVDAAGGQGRPVWLSQGPNASVIGWEGGTILINRLVGDVNRERGISSGRFADFVTLWAIDSAGAAPIKEVGPARADSEYFSAGAIHGGYAWGIGPPRPGGPPQAEVRRLDLGTGQLSDYLAVDPNFDVGPFGFDPTGRLAMLLRPSAASGHGQPKLVIWDATSRVAEIGLPGDFSGGTPSGLGFRFDAHGLWLTSGTGLWFWTAHDGLQRVGDLSALARPTRPTPTPQGAELHVMVAGACQ